MSILLTESAWAQKALPEIVIKRHALNYPSPKLDDASLRYLDHALDTVRGLPERMIVEEREKIFARWISADRLRQLHEATMDPLSAKLAGPFSALSNFEERGASEPVVLNILQRKRLDIGVLEELAGLCVGEARLPVRTESAYSTRDARGQRTEFISAKEVPGALVTICDVINQSTSNSHVMFSALWILVSVLHTHAFQDGNGRLARSLMNAFLIKSGALANGPLPLGPLIYATKGNFRIAINRVTILGDWCPLFRNICVIFEVFARIEREFNETGLVK